MFVPVVDKNNLPLMPTVPSRARRWIVSRKATPFWKNGVFCVRLNQEPSNKNTQKIVVGIDPGSKREAYTVKSNTHTYLNILSETKNWIKDALEVRRNMRRTRRFRKTRYRIARSDNRIGHKLPPSTKSRWRLKLNTCKRLMRIFPITDFVVEDIKAKTKKDKRKWNISFSPLEVGKKWFYEEISKIGNLTIKQGFETKKLRDSVGLDKLKDKLLDSFYSHNVDSWVLANSLAGKYSLPDNEEILKVIPLQFHRRQLHALQPTGGVRRPYGSTMSLGFKRGSLIRYKENSVYYVGGNMNGKISLHRMIDGKRITQNARICDCKFLAFNNQRSFVVFSTGVTP